jgi:hypothetical protein
MSKQVKVISDVIFDGWRVVVSYEHPELFELTVCRTGSEEHMKLKMTKAQFMDLRDLLKAIDCAEKIII